MTDADLFDDLLNDLLDQWEEARQQGIVLKVDELCRDHPHAAEPLRRQIAAIRAVEERMAGSADSEPDQRDQLSVAAQISDLEFFAKGGLGAVYVGEDRQLHRRVAVKFIHAQLARDSACRQRFALEAEVTGRLEHPGIVPVYGIGETDGSRPFYAMRFIDGTTLDEAILRYHHVELTRPGTQVVEFRRLLTSFVSVCKTIAYAHNRGIVHRDVKPDNILLGKYGETLVVDWGLALPVLREERFRHNGEKTLMPSGGSSGSDSSLGAGTPLYMSPEQASGLAPAPTGDIYSLGATLFKILTGAPPVTGNSLEEIKTRIVEGRLRRATEVCPTAPRPLEAICQKAMALHPSGRYATALDLARDVERFLADEPVEAYREPLVGRVSRFGRRHRLATQIAVAGLAVCLVVMGISSVWLGSLAHREQNAREGAEVAQQIAERSRRENLRTSALFLAKSIAQEIDLRWRILEAEAASPRLRELVIDANRRLAQGQPPDAQQLAALQTWLDKRYIANSSAVKAVAWWMNAVEGTQVARVPEAASIGGHFRHRDYFHGLGRDLSPESPEVRELTPLAGKIVHMSAVFESTNTRTLMVAFSVPIWSDSVEESGRTPIGTLAIGVELGDFAIGRHAVLADTRVDQFEGRRGLILHHPRLGLKSSDETLPRLSEAVLDRALVLRAEHRQVSRMHEADHSHVIEQFHDPVDGNERLAVMEPVVVLGRPTDVADTGWIVVAEEAAE